MRWVLGATILAAAATVLAARAGAQGRPQPLRTVLKYDPTFTPRPSRQELLTAAEAAADTSLGAIFPAGRLDEVVWLLRRIQREHRATHELNLNLGSDLHVDMHLADSLYRTIDTATARRTGHTGIRALDSLTESLGGEEDGEFIAILRIVRVWFDKPLNIPGVRSLYDSLPGVQATGFNWDADHSGGITVIVSDSSWTVKMEVGWGDCMAGCINWHQWAFQYRPETGALNVVTDSGPPIPTNRLRN